MKVMRFSIAAAAAERWPRAVRGLLGCGAACLAQLLTYAIVPLRAYPAALAFPAIILSVWFLGMWGGLFCTLAEAVLVNLLPVQTQVQFPDENMPQGVRVTFFLVSSVFLGWAMRRLAQQRTQLRTQELQRSLIMAQAERQVAEEHARTSEALRGRNEVLQTALQANGMGLWVWDLQQGTAYYSDEMCRMTGCELGSIYPSADPWLKHVHPEDVKRVQEAVMQTREGLKDYHEQYRVVRPDGSVCWLESQGKCLRDGEGRPTRVVGVMADVTPRKLTEEAMLRTEKLAVAGRLAAAVAHEINNPLEAVSNLLYLISTAEATETSQSYARMALDELMRVSLITQQTLKFHRQTGSPAITRLSEVVAVVLALFSPRLRSAGITAQVRAVREADVACMPSEIHQIFANLVSNAIDAMPYGGHLVISLHSSHDWRNGKTPGMRVTFADSGLGMSRATMRHSFEPFFTTKAETGTGLGLWVVAQLVERRDGHVKGWSTQRAGASGTAFSVFLPYGAVPVTAAPAAPDPGC
jgi:PAS domain S-box-containing protein